MGQLVNEFAWSNRRSAAFGECKRRYWFESYGHWGGWERGAAERTRRIWILKKLKSRQMWAGEAVHAAIADVLGRMRQGRLVDAREARGALLESMRRQFRQSEAREYLRNPNGSLALYEHEYGEEVPAEEWTRIYESAARCLENFFRSPFFPELCALPASSWLEVEQLQKCRFRGGIPVWVKLDLAYRPAPGRIVIVDWKTGKPDPEPDPLQLTCYAIYAQEKWRAGPGDIETIEYNLAEEQAVRRVVTKAMIEETLNRVSSEVEEMSAYLEGSREENRPLPEAFFPVAADSRTCKRCPFLSVCDDSPLRRIP